MTALIPGTRLKVTSGVGVDSIIPAARTVSKTLVPGVDEVVMADPTLGLIAFVLPDAVTNPGVQFFYKKSCERQ